VVNEAFVKRFFKNGENPIDQRFGMDLPELVNTYRIVGVVRDARFAGFQMQLPPRPMFYLPLAQTVKHTNPMMQRLESQSHFMRGVLLVTDLPAATLEPTIKQTLAAVDPNVTVILLRTLQEQVDRVFDQQRAVASLAGLFGIVALVLAAIGLYGMTAYTVAQRTNEVGIRMALGADRSNVVGMVLRGAFRRVMFGLILGLPLAVGAGYLLSAQLYNVKFWDPLALGVAAFALATCAFVAAILPAMRAASISPIRALRTE
jgi:ABC-type antimicrobial peptide transport system permease subunit